MSRGNFNDRKEAEKQAGKDARRIEERNTNSQRRANEIKKKTSAHNAAVEAAKIAAILRRQDRNIDREMRRWGGMFGYLGNNSNRNSSASPASPASPVSPSSSPSPKLS